MNNGAIPGPGEDGGHDKVSDMTWQERLASAQQILEQHPLVDGHNDLPWAMRLAAGYDLDRVDVGTRQTAMHTDLPRLREGRVGAQF